MNLVKISVIIPCHNRHDLLDRALISVRAQAGIDADFTLEVVVVDDASDPPLAPECSQGDQMIRLDSNRGAAHARNVGCAASTGDIIAFLDSDDIWHYGKLRRQLEVQRNLTGSNADATPIVVCSGYRTRRRSSVCAQDIIPQAIRNLCDFVSGIRFCPGSTALMSRSVFDEIGPFDETLRRLEDYDWYIRLGLRSGRVVVVPEPLATIEPNGVVNRDDVIQSARRIRELHLPHLTPGRIRNRFLSYLNLVEAEANFVNGQRGAAIVELAKSFWRAPRSTLQLLSDEQPTGAVAEGGDRARKYF